LKLHVGDALDEAENERVVDPDVDAGQAVVAAFPDPAGDEANLRTMLRFINIFAENFGEHFGKNIGAFATTSAFLK
jgi:hypothetical protein